MNIADKILLDLYEADKKKFPIKFDVLEALDVLQTLGFIKEEINLHSLDFDSAKEYAEMINESELPSPRMVEYFEKRYSLTNLGRKYIKSKVWEPNEASENNSFSK